jgi:hypothetical protein
MGDPAPPSGMSCLVMAASPGKGAEVVTTSDDAARIRDVARGAGVDATLQPATHAIHVWPVYLSAGLPESGFVIADPKGRARSDNAEHGVR